MKWERLVCSASPHHYATETPHGYYRHHEHRWEETRGLVCRVCEAKMVPQSEVDE